jgi:hypothetical protein
LSGNANTSRLKLSGYYGLAIPEAIEIEITSLDFVELIETANDLTFYLGAIDYLICFQSRHLSIQADDFISSLPNTIKTKILRWLSELLDCLEIGKQ